MANAFCTECGEKLEATSKFCGECGAPTASTADVLEHSAPVAIGRAVPSADILAPPAPAEPLIRAAALSTAPPPTHSTVVMVTATKSVGVAVLLAICFGPLGMFYATVGGGITMLIITFVVALFTLGLGVFITWPICVIWAAIATNSYNAAVVATTTTTK